MKALLKSRSSVASLRNPYVLCLVLCLSLAGCSTYDNKFDCPYGKGLGCASLSKVNKMIDHNQVDVGDGEESSLKKQIHIYHGPTQMGKIIAIDQPRVL